MRIHPLFGCLGAAACIALLPGCGSGGGDGSGSSSVVSSGRMSTITGHAVNSNGSPASGARVTLSNATTSKATRQTIGSTTADVNGNFTFTNVAAGTYTVSVSEQVGAGSPTTVLVTVNISTAATFSLTVTLGVSVPTDQQTGSVFGTITDVSSGNPVPGATVILRSQDDSSLPSLKTTTDVNGKFNFDTVTVGLWSVSVQGRSIANTARSLVEVQAGNASEADLVVAVSTNNGNGNGDN